MRKVKALEILAAAVAVVPCTVFANEDAVPGRPGGFMRPEQQNILRPGSSFGRFALSPAFLPNGGPEDNGNFTWIGPDGGTWQTPTNWTPTGVPDGLAANAFITELNGGGVVTLNGNVTLNSLNFSDPQVAVIAGPTSGAAVTINLAGGQVNVQGFPSERFPSTGKFFGHAIGLPALAPDPARPVILGGSAGLNISTTVGRGGISTRANNTFTGNTTINAGALYTVLPGSSLDGALGASGNLILNGGTYWAEIDNGNMTRSITVNGPGGTLLLGTDPAATAVTTHTFNGVISGSGPLVVDSVFGGNAVFTAANTITGSVFITGAGTNTIQGGGGFASASSVRNSGTLVLNGGGANRLPDAGQLQFNGGALRIENQSGGAYTETVGSTNLLTATPAIVIRASGGGGTVFNGGALTRGAGTGLEVRGDNLGTAPGANVANVNFTNAASFQINNIIPWAFGHNDNPTDFGIENEETEFMNVGPNGLRPLSAGPGYVENTFAGAGATSNVRLRAGVNGQAGNNPNYTVPGNITINSLTMAPGFDESTNGVGGIFLNGAPGTTITLTSGGLLSSTSGFTGTAINSGVGNTVNVNIAAPAGVELVFNSPGALTMNGNVIGSGGLTKTGVRTLFMNGTGSTYTGTTTLTGFNRHKGDLIAGAPSAYGQSTSDILLVPFDRIQNDPGLGATGINFVSFGPDAGQGATTMTRNIRILPGGTGEILSVLFRNFSTGTFNIGGQITVDAGADAVFQSLAGGANSYNVTGNIVGAGHVSTAPTQENVTLRLAGNNTFSGGFDFAGGIVIADSNTAFGTGLITMSAGTNNLSSTTGPRTISNNMLTSGGRMEFTGSNPFTFTGNVALQGGLFDIESGAATFSGVLSEGSFFKEGAGTIFLTGNNTFHGALSAGNLTAEGAAIDGGWIVLSNNGAAGSAVGTAQVLGASAIALTGGITTADKPVLMTSASNGPDGQGALRSLSGNNTWGGGILLVDLAAAPGGPTNGSAGANAGATLTIGRSVFVSGSGASSTFQFTKFGPGQVNVGAEQFTATRSSGATSSFQGSIIGVNHLRVEQGRLAMLPSGGGPKRVSDVGSISFGAGAQFDLTDGALVVDYEGASPFADIRNQIISGFAGGAWTGPGIISSLGNAGQFGVGYAEASNVLTFTGSPPDALFLGDVVDNTAVLARFTRYGDANLDGTVNLGDFNRLAANFGTGTRWDQGDFTYDGIVNLADFNRLAANFGLSAAGPEVTPEDWAALGAAIPEPSSLALAGIGAVAMLRRRRRHSR